MRSARSLDLGDEAVFVLADGLDLRAFDRLSARRGCGARFTDEAAYRALKTNPRAWWAVRELASGRVLASSSNALETVYGASLTKVLVVAAALSAHGGRLPTAEHWRAAIRLVVDSDNTPWEAFERLAGGERAMNDFTAKLGYRATRAAGMTDNAVNALELTQFYLDVMDGKFCGADALFALASACRTGGDRAPKYLPASVRIGGKTGTLFPSFHDTRFLCHDGSWFSIAVLTQLGSEEAVAVLFAGLFHEYVA